jgi:CDP-glucose 4,6-dehydratase
MLLRERGHEVSGISLDPEPGSLFTVAGLEKLLVNDVREDIRDAEKVLAAVQSVTPDVVIHLAAQPLVRRSYLNPQETFETNVNGTLNVLQAVWKTPTVKACLVITTDKVYRNLNQIDGYKESDALGGHDPYSASKAMADILTQSWVKSFEGPPTAIARAGNVIGGGDVCEDRLVPDAVRAFASGQPLTLRFPDSVRPWQHVLDCLNGYLCLVDNLLIGKGTGEWNFGPGEESFVAVREFADIATQLWSSETQVSITSEQEPHEAGLLALDSSKARTHLGWNNKLKFPDSLEWTLSLEKQRRDDSADVLDLCKKQIEAFEAL